MQRIHLFFASIAVLGGIVTGCTGPTLGTPDASAGDNTLVVFLDPDSDFATTDVRDIDEQIVRFDGDAKTMIWVSDDVEFPGWEASGNFLGATQFFQVRFGTQGGQRRAYFTEAATATICDIEVVNGNLSISPTSVLVPQN